MEKITVSIITATFNRAHLISATLKSIQDQVFQDWECLVIDDGSQDHTASLVAGFSTQDSRFQYHKRPDAYLKGLPGCRNFGLDLAKGDCVIFFDDDDIVHFQNLQLCLEAFQKQPSDFVHYQKRSFESQPPEMLPETLSTSRVMDRNDLYKVILQQIGMASCTVLWRKHCFDKVRFNETLAYAEEWECYLRILSQGRQGIILNNVLYFNLKHPKSNTHEFFDDNPQRRTSKKDAILLVVQNLSEKGLLTFPMMRYFVVLSNTFAEFRLFEQLLEQANLSITQKLGWHIFYITIPLQLAISRTLKNIKKRLK